jgi:ATP-dependent Clp protease, protease subunit
MELRHWIRQMFLYSQELDGKVPFLDPKSGKVMPLPPSELPSDAILVRHPSVDWLVWSTPDYVRGAKKMMDLLTLFPEERAVLLCGPIFDDLANLVVAQLLFLHFDDPVRPIHLMINSLGGGVCAALAIRDTMDFIKQPVHTCCLEVAGGMAGVLLIHGARGHRSAFRPADLSVGSVTGRSNTPAAQENLHKIVRCLTEMVAADTGWPDDIILSYLRGAERHFSADEALEYGLIDEILESR